MVGEKEQANGTVNVRLRDTKADEKEKDKKERRDMEVSVEEVVRCFNFFKQNRSADAEKLFEQMAKLASQ